MYRYQIYFNENQSIYIFDENLTFRRNFIIWSCLPLLVSLVANEDTTNIPQLMKNIMKYIDKSILCICSPKLLLNGLQMHICQLLGITNLVAFGYALKGYELPFKNFKYMFKNSNYQWFRPRKPEENQLLENIADCWKYQNNWNVNELKKVVLQAFM